MITAQYCQTMARYNAWQNESLSACMQALTMKELQKDRKVFFGSIWATANHLLWADQLWMSRFDGGPEPAAGSITDSTGLHDDKQLFLDDRLRTDQRIMRWSKKLRQIDLAGPLTWYSGAAGRDMAKPVGLCIAHFFNHQTHHRGQIHAMLTAAGQTPAATDLVFMPD